MTTGALAQDLALTPALDEPVNHVIYMTANGFAPAFLTVKPGAVVQWVNADLAEHATIRTGAWDSGLLAADETYPIKLEAEGLYAYADGTDQASTGMITVQADTGEEPPAANLLYLPLVAR